MGDFASAFADLRALEPIATVPILALTPDASFGLAAVGVKGFSSQNRAARGERTPLRAGEGQTVLRAPRAKNAAATGRDC
jgi:hypothetical protein